MSNKIAASDIRWPTVDKKVSVKDMTVQEYTAFRGLDALPELVNGSDVFMTIRDIAQERGMFVRTLHQTLHTAITVLLIASEHMGKAQKSSRSTLVHSPRLEHLR